MLSGLGLLRRGALLDYLFGSTEKFLNLARLVESRRQVDFLEPV